MSLRVGLDGCKLAHDFEARRSREILDTLERHYGLRPAAEGDAKQTYDTLLKLDYTKSDLKRQLASLVRSTRYRYYHVFCDDRRTRNRDRCIRQVNRAKYFLPELIVFRKGS